MNQAYIDKVANQLIEQLQQGTAPWQKPWKAGELRAPFNPTTGNNYKGVNNIWLQMQGFSDPRWMTFNQAGDAGARIRKGSKGTPIVYWAFTEEREAKDASGNVILMDGRPKKITVELEKPKSFTFTVFNAEQIDGLPPLEAKPIAPEAVRCIRAETVLEATGATIKHEQGDRAFYHPAKDEIVLPERDQFSSSEGYYATALHELGHWTGHADRLNRDLAHPFGSVGYAKEELRAEIASLMMSEKLDLPHDPSQHASYLASWIKVLHDDPREIFRASADAERISEHVLALESDKQKSVDQNLEADSAQEIQEMTDEPAMPALSLADQLLFKELKETVRNYKRFVSGPEDPDTAPARDFEDDFDIHESYIRKLQIELEAAFSSPTLSSAFRLNGYSLDQLLSHSDADDADYERARILTEAMTAMDRSPRLDRSELKEQGKEKHRPETINFTHDDQILLSELREIARNFNSFVSGPDDPDTAPTRDPEDSFGIHESYERQIRLRLEAAFNSPTLSSAFNEAGYKFDQLLIYSDNQDEDLEQARFLLNAIKAIDVQQQAQERHTENKPNVLHDRPTKSLNDRVVLAVPYSEKDEAKAAASAAGIKIEWDRDAKAWWVPADADMTALAKWRTDAPRVVSRPVDDAPDVQFAKALGAEGLIIDGVPLMDGKLHRVAVEGDKGGQTSGAYVGHVSGQLPAGYIQNFRSGAQVNWKADGVVDQISAEERARLNAEAAMQRDKRALERAALQEQTAVVATAFWEASPQATAENAYCKAKGLENAALAGMRVVPEKASAELAALGIRIAKTSQEAKALREEDPTNRVFKAGDLLIPGQDLNGRIWTLQSVNPSFKSFMKDGRKHGLMTVAGASDLNSALNHNQIQPIIVAEGVSTADAVSKLSGQPVIVAFDSGNLDAVCSALRERYPARPMFIAADNDHQAVEKIGANGLPMVNVGQEKAHAAAAKVGAGVITPDFDRQSEGSDWNDLHAEKGDEAARRHFAEQMAAARVEATLAAHKIANLADELLNQLQNDPKLGRDDEAMAKARVENAHALVFASAQLDEVYGKTATALVEERVSLKQPTAVQDRITDNLDRLKEGVRDERSHMLSKPEQAEAKEPEQAPKDETVPVKPKPRPRHADMDMGY